MGKSGPREHLCRARDGQLIKYKSSNAFIGKEKFEKYSVEYGVTAVETQHGITGRLEHHAMNWEVITKDRWVLETVKGYILDRVHKHTQAGKETTPTLLRCGANQPIKGRGQGPPTKGAVSQLPTEQSATGFYLNLFLVPKKDDRQRPVINLKALNEFVAPVHFKMETL